MSKQITVIVPVYNGSRFIRKCISSIVSQKGVSLDLLDILLINDGSTDDSISILKEYEAAYPNSIRVLDQVNKGAAYTRNLGIGMALGAYVMFIDQDDYIDSDYCRVLFDEIETKHLDIVQGGYVLVEQNDAIIKHVAPVNSVFGRFLAIPAWGKIHRTEFLKAKNIQFLANNIGEDNIFTVQEIVRTTKYGCINYAGYRHVEDNRESVTNSLHRGLKEEVDIIALLQGLRSIATESVKMRRTLEYVILRTGVYYLLLYGRGASSTRFNIVHRDIFQWVLRNLPRIFWNHNIWWRPKGEKLSAQLGVVMIIVFTKLHLIKIFSKVYCKG